MIAPARPPSLFAPLHRRRPFWYSHDPATGKVTPIHTPDAQEDPEGFVRAMIGVEVELRGTRRRVGLHDFGKLGSVSTVFLMLDHSYADGPPVLWETMIFGGLLHHYQERYTSEREAIAGHKLACRLVLASPLTWAASRVVRVFRKFKSTTKERP